MPYLFGRNSFQDIWILHERFKLGTRAQIYTHLHSGAKILREQVCSKSGSFFTGSTLHPFVLCGSTPKSLVFEKLEWEQKRSKFERHRQIAFFRRSAQYIVIYDTIWVRIECGQYWFFLCDTFPTIDKHFCKIK